MVFDSISDAVQYAGIGKTYMFLKHAIEMINQPRVTTLFLIMAGAHDEKVRNLLMSLFGNQLVLDSSGLRIARQTQK